MTPLWERYFERLTHHAAKYLRYARRSDYSEEDAALSAIYDFCDGLARGKLHFVDSREVLWGTLAKITERKVLRRLRGKRFRKEVKLTDLQSGESSDEDCGSRKALVEPTDDYREIVRTEIEDLIDGLPNAHLHRPP